MGWCENNALVYYLFANAAGIKTRLVDIAGKFGPLKLTGHYFCESWIPEEASWCYVDPQFRIASIAGTEGHHISTLELKKLHDLGTIKGYIIGRYDRNTGEIVSQIVDGTNLSGDYFTGDLVLAYKFGYGNNKGFSKIKNFILYDTLLYAPFPVPGLNIMKHVCLKGFVISMVFTVILGVWFIASGKSRDS